MNYAPKIMDLLCHRDHPADILLVAGAPALMREAESLRPFTETPLSPDDLVDTLSSLLARLRVGQKVLERDGSFSFGIPLRGRFRVSYVTQRGSYAVTISPIPLSVASLSDILEAPDVARVSAAIMAAHRGLLVIASSQLDDANRLVYAMISHLNQHTSRVVFMLEPHVTYLMKHQRGIIMQSEIGTDVNSIAEGVQGSLLMGANVLYARGVSLAEDFAQLLHAAKNSVVTLVTMACSDMGRLLPGGQIPLEPNMQIGVWRVEPGDAAGMLKVSIDAASGGGERTSHGQD